MGDDDDRFDDLHDLVDDVDDDLPPGAGSLYSDFRWMNERLSASSPGLGFRISQFFNGRTLGERSDNPRRIVEPERSGYLAFAAHAAAGGANVQKTAARLIPPKERLQALDDDKLFAWVRSVGRGAVPWLRKHQATQSATCRICLGPGGRGFSRAGFWVRTALGLSCTFWYGPDEQRCRSCGHPRAEHPAEP